MGVEGTCRSPNGGGGCHLLHTRYISTSIHYLQALQSPPALRKVSNQGKTGQKWIFLWSFLSTPRNFGDNKRQKPNIFLKVGRKTAGDVQTLRLPSSCPLGAGLQDFEGFRTWRRLALVIWSCVPAFCRLYCVSLGALLANMALFRVLRGFLEGFMCFVCVCMG